MSNATSFGQGSSPELAALREQKQVNGAGEALCKWRISAQVEDFGQAQALGEQAEALEARPAAAKAGGTPDGQPAEVRHACPCPVSSF